MALFIKHTPNSLQTDSISGCLPNKRRLNAIFDRETILKQSERDLKDEAATSSFLPLPFSLVEEKKKMPPRSQSPDIKATATLRGNPSWPPCLVHVTSASVSVAVARRAGRRWWRVQVQYGSRKGHARSRTQRTKHPCGTKKLRPDVSEELTPCWETWTKTKIPTHLGWISIYDTQPRCSQIIQCQSPMCPTVTKKGK